MRWCGLCCIQCCRAYKNMQHKKQLSGIFWKAIWKWLLCAFRPCSTKVFSHNMPQGLIHAHPRPVYTLFTSHSTKIETQWHQLNVAVWRHISMPLRMQQQTKTNASTEPKHTHCGNNPNAVDFGSFQSCGLKRNTTNRSGNLGVKLA